MSQQNLDNYFAKFLSPGRRHQAATPSERQDRAVAPSTSSPEEAAQNPTPSNAAEGPRTVSSPTAPPKALFPAAAAPNDHFLVLTDSGVVEEAWQSRKRGRESDTATAAPPPRPPRPARQGTADEEEEELDLLLGKEQAEQVKAFDALLDSAVASAHKPGSARSERETVDADTADIGSAVAVASLPWSTTSSSRLKKVADSFVEQFKYELKTNEELFTDFEPFFLDKKLDRIEASTQLYRRFLPAPRITKATTGAISGCDLRDYQVEGVQFLLDRFHRGMSCVLSDDMGLGKTAQIASFIHTLKRLHGIEGPHLIVAPLSTLTNWTRELARWAPTLRVVKYHGERQARRAARYAESARHAVFVTTPAVLNGESGFFRKRSWVTVLVDEAHVLKGHNTKITRIAHKLTACFRVAITGTPVHNNVREVWNMMSFLYPSMVAGYDSSNEDTVAAAQNCARLLQHIMLRRTKETMELGIPPRVDEPLTFLEPTYAQSELLAQLTTQALHGSSTALTADGEGEEVTDKDAAASGNGGLYAHLSHQRVVCNHPMQIRLLAADAKCGGSAPLDVRLKVAGIPMTEEALIHPSAKMRYLDTLLPTLKADGHRVLIFSNFTTTLDLLQAMCLLRGYSFERLDGSCTRVERELSMLRYNAAGASCFIFLVTTTAGGVGVTLTGADTVILFDAHFNPQLDRQAADRAHRIGQTRVVHVHRLCLRNTVEEHIRTIAERKASLGDFIVEGGQRQSTSTGDKDRQRAKDLNGPRLTADDVRAIFERAEQRMQEQREAQERERQAAQTRNAQEDDAVSASQATRHDAEDALVADLMEIEENGLPGPVMPASRLQASTFSDHHTTDHCFVCGEIMHPLEPLLHCAVCPKAYHAACIGLPPPKPGDSVKRTWSCPRHRCTLCGKQAATDGAIFMCVSCPRSFCFDCLDPRYLALNDSGTELLHIHKKYPGMDAEGVEAKRSSYYVTCLRCSGVESSSEEEESDPDSDDDGSGEAEESDADTSVEIVDSTESD